MFGKEANTPNLLFSQLNLTNIFFLKLLVVHHKEEKKLKIELCKKV